MEDTLSETGMMSSSAREIDKVTDTNELRFRQIHLDFHTSQHIIGIGATFDPDLFAATLEEAHINSITCFARCHHGYIYFDTQKHPERKHPHLQRNLLAEQIEACHARNIRVPIYTTIQWDHFTAEQHPEWLALQADGRIKGTQPYEAGFYRYLCVNSPYLGFLKEHIQEILETLPVDGLFLDIVIPLDDSSKWTRTAMADAGMDPSDPLQRRAYGQQVIDAFKREMTSFIRQCNKVCTIFYNDGHIGIRDRNTAEVYTHFELESLPNEGWSYLHFPISVRYARNLGRECLGMTGKFHTFWGDFHSYKNQAALQFECFRMLTLNAKCSVGDQLHPSGKMDQATYRLIGSVYAEVAKKEPWCSEACPLTEIGVLTTEEFYYERVPAETAGAVRMLQEGSHQFEVLDTHSDFSAYSVLILPDEIPVSTLLVEKLEQYLEQGGKFIASYHSGLNPSQDAFVLKALGVQVIGPAPFSPDFILPKGIISRGLPEIEHVMYLRGMDVIAQPGSEVLASVMVPYFNRTYQHFCSHRHTPSSGQPGYPGIIRNGSVIYFAHPIFTQYHRNAPRWCKTLFLNALDILLPEPLVRIQGPSTLLTAINAQTRKDRWVLHLLHYIPERRGQEFDVIEDVIPLYNIRVSIRVPRTIRQVTCVPDRQALPWTIKNERLEFTVPEINGHQMVEVAFK